MNTDNMAAAGDAHQETIIPNVESVKKCETKCSGSKFCLFYSFDQKGTTCTLRYPKTIAEIGVISGPRECYTIPMNMKN